METGKTRKEAAAEHGTEQRVNEDGRTQSKLGGGQSQAACNFQPDRIICICNIYTRVCV